MKVTIIASQIMENNKQFNQNFPQYFQLIAAIPSCLKKTAQEIAVTKRDLLKEQEVFTFLTIGHSP